MKNVKELLLTDIKVSENNPRKHFDEDKLRELTVSIKEKGVIEPIIVRAISEKYELVCGERRWRASKAAGVKTIPAVIRELTDTEALEFQIIENLHREDLNAIDEGLGFKVMLEQCKYTQEDLATKVGKSRTYIGARIRLLQLSAEIQKAIAENKITPGHGMVLLRLAPGGDRRDLFKRILRDKLSVRISENALDRYGRVLAHAVFNTKQCAGCRHNGKEQKDLFDKETNLKGRCLNPQCFKKKMDEYVQETKKQLKKKGFDLMPIEELCKKAKKDEFAFADITRGTWRRSELGKKYVTQCKTCPNHFYVTDTAKWGEMKGIVEIKELCADQKCAQRSVGKPAEKAKTSNADRSARRKQVDANRLYEAKVRFFTGQLPTRKTKFVTDIIALYHSIRNLDFGAAEAVLEDEKYEYGVTYRALYNLGPEKVKKALEKATSMHIQKLSYNLEALECFAEESGIDIGKEFVIDEDYVRVKSKDQLIALAKEIGLDIYLKEKGIRTAGVKKSEMIDFFLKEGFELKGKIPKEITRG